MKETLGERITRLRTERGMSQGALADALDISRQSVSKWETNTSIPELDKLIRLAELFGVSMDLLILGREALPDDGSIEMPDKPNPISQETPSSPPQTEDIPLQTEANPKPQSGKRRVSRIVGIILIGLSVLVILYGLFGMGTDGFLSTAVGMAPFWICGILCLTLKRRIWLWCAWVCYLTLEVWTRFWISWLPLSWLTVMLGIFLIVATAVSYRNARLPFRIGLKWEVWTVCVSAVGLILFRISTGLVLQAVLYWGPTAWALSLGLLLQRVITVIWLAGLIRGITLVVKRRCASAKT